MLPTTHPSVNTTVVLIPQHSVRDAGVTVSGITDSLIVDINASPPDLVTVERQAISAIAAFSSAGDRGWRPIAYTWVLPATSGKQETCRRAQASGSRPPVAVVVCVRK